MGVNGDNYLRAKALFMNGVVPGALELLGFQLEMCPDDARSLELRGVILHSIHSFVEARRSIETAGLIRELSAPALLALADCYWFTSEKEMAAAIFRSLAKRANLPEHLLSGLAMGLGRLNDFHAAIAVCKRGVIADPMCHQARYGVAFYMSKAGYPPEFVFPIVRKMVELAPTVFHYRMSMATLLCRMNNPSRAYLTVADASFDELQTVHCGCCLERLIGLYETALDKQRATKCRELLRLVETDCTDESC